MARIRGVVFDLDDTLFDHRGSSRVALQAWLPGLGVSADEGLVRRWFELEDRHFERWRAGEISFAEQRRGRLRDLFPILGRPVGSEAELDATFADYLAAYRSAWRPFPDVEPTLTQLAEAGLRLAILTNGTAEQQHAKVAAVTDHDRFAVVLTSEEIGCAKPDPEAYHAVCRALGLLPAEVVHVGDRLDLDVLAARAAGLAAFHLDRHGTRREPAATRLDGLDALPYRIALSTRRHDAEQQREALLAAIEQTRSARRLTFSDDEHDPDGSLASLDQARDVALLEAVEQTLARLAAAHQRLTEGVEATCESCGAEIGSERLLARPETRRCVRCATGSDRGRGNRRRDRRRQSSP